MRYIILCFFLVLALAVPLAHAGEVREIELTDGSVITGEVLSLSSGVYTIKSNSLGTIKVEEAKIRAIRAKSPDAGPGASSDVKALQGKMMSNAEIMNLIQSLQNDPEFKKVLEDPEIMKAVNAGDVASLTSNPKFLKLLDNPAVQEIQRKVK